METARHRAIRITRAWVTSRFLGVMLLVAFGAAFAVGLGSLGHTVGQSAALGAIGTVLGPVVAIGGCIAVNLVRAPLIQRDECREQVAGLLAATTDQAKIRRDGAVGVLVDAASDRGRDLLQVRPTFRQGGRWPRHETAQLEARVNAWLGATLQELAAVDAERASVLSAEVGTLDPNAEGEEMLSFISECLGSLARVRPPTGDVS